MNEDILPIVIAIEREQIPLGKWNVVPTHKNATIFSFIYSFHVY